MQSAEVGTKFMNKIPELLCLTLALSSCGVLRVNEYSDLMKGALFGAEDILIDQQFHDNQKFSFAKVRLGRNNIATLTLGFMQKDSLQWFSSSQSSIITKNGRIINLTDFSNDMSISNPPIIVFKKDMKQVNSLGITLKDPEAFFIQDSAITYERSEKIEHLSKLVDVELYLERVTTKGLHWNFINKYWVDPSSGMVIQSEQTVHPRLPVINISYYYKYLD